MGDEPAVEVQEALEAPERGSADELLDAGAHAPIDAMRHSAAHVMAEAVLDLFPGAKLGIGPAIDDGFYYDFDLPRPLTPEDLAAIEARMAAERRGGPPVRPHGAAVRRGARPRSPAQGRPTRSRSSTTWRRGRATAGEPPPGHDLLRARAVQRPVQGPARGDDRRDRPLQAALRRRRLLARRREAADAPADLRDGLGDPGGAGPVPVAPRGGQEARPPQARRPRSTSSASTTSARARPSGTPRASGSGGRSSRRCASSRSGAATRRSARRCSSTRSCGSSRATGTSTGTTCSSSSPRARRSRLKPMNCPESTFIYKSRLRSYRDLPLRLSEYGRPPSQRAVRDALGPDPRSPLHPGRQPHLRPPGPAGRRDRGPAGRGRRGLLLVRPRAAGQVRHEARQGPRRPGALGAGRGADPGGARALRPAVTASSPGTGPSTPRRSTSTSRTPSGASGRRRRSRSTSSCCPSASTWSTSTRTASRSARWRSTGPSTARSSGSSAILVEHFAGAFPLWLRAGPGRRDPDRRPPRRACPRAGGRAARAPASGSRSTTRTGGCRTRSAWRRSRRFPTCSCSVIARWRRAPLPRERAPASSSRPRDGRPWPSGSRPRRPSGAQTEGRAPGRPVRASASTVVLFSAGEPRPVRACACTPFAGVQ